MYGLSGLEASEKQTISDKWTILLQKVNGNDHECFNLDRPTISKPLMNPTQCAILLRTHTCNNEIAILHNFSTTLNFILLLVKVFLFHFEVQEALPLFWF